MKQSTPTAELKGAAGVTRNPPGGHAPAIDLREWKQPLVGGVVVLGLLVLLFYGFFRSQVIRAYTEQADWGHIFVIPFIAGYFVHLNRVQLLARPFKTTWTGLPLMIAGMAVYMISVFGPPTLNHLNIQGFGVWLTICGLVLLFFGWRAMRWLWFPLVYLFCFGQYISEKLLNTVTFQMQDVTARGAAVLLSLFLQVEREGNVISIIHNGVSTPLNIAQACSGMRMLVAFMALGVAMGYTGFRPLPLLPGAMALAERRFAEADAARGWRRAVAAPLQFMAGSVIALPVLAARNWQRIALFLMAVPTAIFVNILRVCTLGVLTLLNVDFAAGEFHTFVGLVWLIPAFLIYLGLMWVIRHVLVEEKPARARRKAVEAG